MFVVYLLSIPFKQLNTQFSRFEHGQYTHIIKTSSEQRRFVFPCNSEFRLYIRFSSNFYCRLFSDTFIIIFNCCGNCIQHKPTFTFTIIINYVMFSVSFLIIFFSLLSFLVLGIRKNTVLIIVVKFTFLKQESLFSTSWKNVELINGNKTEKFNRKNGNTSLK